MYFIPYQNSLEGLELFGHAHSFARRRLGLPASGGLIFYSLAYPAHDWDGHAVAQRLVARAVRAISGRLAPVWNQGVIVWKSLEPFTLARGDAAYPAMLRGNQRISFHPAVPCALIGMAGTCYCWSDRRTNKVMVLIPGRAACAFRPLARHGLPHYMGDIESSLGSVVIRATCSKASCKGLGNVRPLLFARRSIPAQALGFKKYRCGRSPVSKMSDNVDSAATLGDSEKLSVKHSPRARIPDVVQRPEECPEVPSAVC